MRIKMFCWLFNIPYIIKGMEIVEIWQLNGTKTFTLIVSNPFGMYTQMTLQDWEQEMEATGFYAWTNIFEARPSQYSATLFSHEIVR